VLRQSWSQLARLENLFSNDSQIARLPIHQKERYHLYRNLSAEFSGQLLQARVSGKKIAADANLPPVDQCERIAELLNPLVVGGVARYQLQPLIDSNGGDHGVRPADGLADAVKIAGNAARQLGGGDIQGENLFRGDGHHEGVQTLELLGFLVSRTISSTVTVENE
jgi:hypothetical protein